MSEKIYEVNGGSGRTLEVYEDHCSMQSQKNISALVMGNIFSGNKDYLYSDLTSVQFKKASRILKGYLEFEYAGSRSASGLNSMTSENSFAFELSKVTNEKMEEIVNYIKDHIKEAKKQTVSVVTQQVSSADELKKFKELLDGEIITQEEFDAKKKEILGL